MEDLGHIMYMKPKKKGWGGERMKKGKGRNGEETGRCIPSLHTVISRIWRLQTAAAATAAASAVELRISDAAARYALVPLIDA